MRAGTLIRILEDTKCLCPSDTIIEKYEVVTVLHDNTNSLIIKNVLDEGCIIPYVNFKILKNGNDELSPNDLAIVKRLKLKHITACVTAAPALKKINDSDSTVVRAIQKFRTVCSNVCVSENILESNRLLLSAIYAQASLNPNLSSNQANTLLQLSNKLLST